MEGFAAFNASRNNAKVDEHLADLVCQGSVDAAFAVKSAGLAAGSIFKQKGDDLRMTA